MGRSPGSTGLTLFCFTEPLSRMCGQSLPVSSALMSATGTAGRCWADHRGPRRPRAWGGLEKQLSYPCPCPPYAALGGSRGQADWHRPPCPHTAAPCGWGTGSRTTACLGGKGKREGMMRGALTPSQPPSVPLPTQQPWRLRLLILRKSVPSQRRSKRCWRIRPMSSGFSFSRSSLVEGRRAADRTDLGQGPWVTRESRV